MSRPEILLSLAATAAFMGCDASTLAQPELTPSFAAVEATSLAHASGGGTVVTSAGTSTYAFHGSANGAGIVRGTVELHFSSVQATVHANVTCLAIQGNDAWFGAVVTRSDFETGNFVVGGDFVWKAQDNGEGANADSTDQVSRFFGGPSADFCNTQFPVSQKDWTNGNVQVSSARAPGPPPGPVEYCSDGIAIFADPGLEAAVRSGLGLTAEDALTCENAGTLQNLNAGDAGITDLSGIQSLTGLLMVELGGNSITDISAVSGLSNVWFLGLFNNSVEDITPIGGLTGLTGLELGGNSISDISAVGGLANLTYLGLGANAISDITPVSDLASLLTLGLGGNPFTDISAVSGLVGLERLYFTNGILTDIGALVGLVNLQELSLLSNTGLSNIQPLLLNTGLGAGDNVYLGNTAVDCGDVLALLGKGVTVTSDC